MADLTDIQSALPVKISGSSLTGTETNLVNADANGNMYIVNNNAGGASAVNIQDGGNSITIDQLSEGPVTPGAAATKSQLGGAVYNTTLPTLTNGQQTSFQADTRGRLVTSATIIESTRLTYSAAANGFVAAATPTDVFTITGAANKIIKITKIEITSTTTSGSGISTTFNLIKRSTANSGGTSSTLTNVAHDSTNAAATATVLSYTANPTLGTSLGLLASRRVQIQPASSPGPIVTFEWGGQRASQSPILRSTSEVLAINFNSVSITGNITSIFVEWTEEDA